MASGEGSKKEEYVARVKQAFRTYTRLLIVSADNVGSNHFQSIRVDLRPDASVLMGKNTLIRRALRLLIEEEKRDDLKVLLPYIKRNIGIVFTSGSLSDAKKLVDKNKVPAAAKTGTVAPCDVVVPSGPTGMEPTKTSFLQAVGISSKIVKGQIEIISDTLLLKKGDRVAASHQVLLETLKIRPFYYGLVPLVAYDNGALFDSSVLDMSDDDLLNKFRSGVNAVAAVSLAVGYPTVVSVPHTVINGYKNVLSVSLATTYSFDRSKKLKDLLDNPEALAALAKAASSSAAAGGAAAKKEEKAEEKEEKKEVEEDFGGGGGLFGDDEGW